MSNIVAIGDTHGRDLWKDIVAKEVDADRFIFMGDYFDSWNCTPEECLKNFQDILDFKTENKAKVILLIGNHDHHYIAPGQRYSGFQDHAAVAIGDLIHEALQPRPLLQMAHWEDGFLFTHAGVTHEWADKHIQLDELHNQEEMASNISMLYEIKPAAFDFYSADGSGFGDHISQGPIWVRPKALRRSPLENYKQVVGHTTVRSIEYDNSNIFIDAIESRQYLKIVDGVPESCTI